jgi:hypothetical protein
MPRNMQAVQQAEHTGQAVPKQRGKMVYPTRLTGGKIAKAMPQKKQQKRKPRNKNRTPMQEALKRQVESCKNGSKYLCGFKSTLLTFMKQGEGLRYTKEAKLLLHEIMTNRIADMAKAALLQCVYERQKKTVRPADLAMALMSTAIMNSREPELRHKNLLREATQNSPHTY